MKRPILNEVPIPIPLFEPTKVYATMSPGQWDTLLQAFYDQGCTLLEVEEINGVEKITRAYRNPIQTLTT